MTPRHALLPVFAAATLLSCGGGEKEPAAEKPRAKASAPAPRADDVNGVAERVMDEVPGCTPDQTEGVTAAGKKDGLVAIRTGICEDGVLEGVTLYEFRDEKASAKHRESYWLLDNPDAKDGELVASGNVVCQEEFRGGKDSVNCMLVVKQYILLAHGKRGADTSAVMDRRMGALARAAE